MTSNVHHTPVEFKVDTGSQANIIPISVYERINVQIVPNLANITAPIRELLKKEVEFHRSYEQVKSFNQIKEILTSQPGPVLKFLDPTKPVTVRCDASKNGLGAVLIQEEQPIAYASRSLSAAETRYAQIIKELLSVLFALERFNVYTYGAKVLVENDHKPLEIILKKSLQDAPIRLQRMLLRLQKYDFVIKHKPGKDLIVVDTLSRAPLPVLDPEIEKEISYYAHTVVSNMPMSDEMMQRLQRATSEDESISLQQLKTTVFHGWPETKKEAPVKVREFWHCREEISEINAILLKNERVIVPNSLRTEMLEKIHAGHMGVEKSKRRARDILYWPGMNGQIEEMILKCSTCLEYRPSNQKVPLVSQPTPVMLWDTVATDLFHWQNSDYLQVVDYLSRFFEVSKLPDTKSSTIVTYMKSIFARHGIPREVRSDNGPQYKAQEFRKSAQDWNFLYVTTSPHHPQANGLAERTVQTVKKESSYGRKRSIHQYSGVSQYASCPDWITCTITNVDKIALSNSHHEIPATTQSH